MPAYDLDEVKRLVELGRASLAKRPVAFLKARYDAPREVVRGVFAAMEAKDYRKTVWLNLLQGVRADVYGSDFDDILRYVKFFEDDSGEPWVHIWSCSWDGCLH